VDPGLLLLPQRVYSVQELAADQVAALQAWFKALFSRDSEGIDDHILRTTPPLTLLRIAPTLFSEALAMATLKAIDLDAIRNGCQFFFDDILNWTLVGVIKVSAGLIKMSSCS
jgi:mediator of RNA polymerase II transcription subunit 5